LKVIAFDLDDTLYPERSYVLSGFAAVAKWAQDELEIPAAQGLAELRQLFESGVRADTFNRWLTTHGLEADLLVPSMVQVYRSHQPDIQPYDDTVSALDEMRVAYRLALVTEGFGEVQAMKLESIGLQDYFEFVHIGDENEREKWKPSQYPFERMLDQMSVSGNQAAYVGIILPRISAGRMSSNCSRFGCAGAMVCMHLPSRAIALPRPTMNFPISVNSQSQSGIETQ
jgi:putative hydrolase of the HAD superfamily